MATLWGTKLWNTFKWGQSEAFAAAMAALTGSHPVMRIIWKLDAGDQDITRYFSAVSSVSQEKERAPDTVTAGDASLVFMNTSGVFTPMNPASFLYGVKYHNRNITIELGFELDSGTTEYVFVATMKARSLVLDSGKSSAKLQVYDQVARLIGETINATPDGMVPVPGGTNVGDGDISEIKTRPFDTLTENWTLTCTLGGGDGAPAAQFSVVGSVSGSIGPATSGVEFVSEAAGLKFDIRGGDADWVIGDSFTFSTYQTMEWTEKSPVKILWSLLTGTNYDTGADEPWKTRTPQLSSLQTYANPDIDWMAMQAAVTNLDFVITGFIPWDYDLVDAMQEILLQFLGSCNIDGQGRVFVKVFRPAWAASQADLADTKKITGLTVTEDMREMINQVTVRYRKLPVWPWSNEDEIEGLDGKYVAANNDSFTDYKQWFGKKFDVRWYNAQAENVLYFAQRIIDKYGKPPRRFSGDTGLDALLLEIGDIITISDEKLGFDKMPIELMKKEGEYDQSPKKIHFEGEDTGTVGYNWAYCGSSVDEGDGISPQAADFDSASATDKLFAYASQTGGSGGNGPDYFCY